MDMGEKPRIRRPRGVNTCKECRLRKVKCDFVRPRCSRCQQLGISCIYPDMAVRKCPIAPENWNQPLSQLSAHMPLAGPSHNSQSESAHRLQQLLSNPDGSQLVSQSVPAWKRARIDKEPVERPGAGIPGEHLAIQSHGRTKYVSGYHWASICCQRSQLDELLQSQNRYTSVETGAQPSLPESSKSTSSQGSSETQSRSSSASARTVSTDYIEYALGGIFAQLPVETGKQTFPTSKHQRLVHFHASQLPSKQQCDFLVENFIKSYQPIAPTIHVPTFLREYKSLQNALDANNQECQCRPPVVALLFAVILAGSLISSTTAMDYHFPSTPRSQVSLDLYTKAVTALQHASFATAPSLESFAAYLIVHAVWEREEEPLRCSYFVGVAVRTAQMLGLNRDPSHFPDLDPIVAEWRRRLAWQLYYYDVTIAMAAGLLPMIEAASWDVQLVSEVQDDLIGTPEAIKYERSVASGQRSRLCANETTTPCHRPLVSTAGIFGRAKFNSYRIVNRLRSYLYDSRSTSNEGLQIIWDNMAELRIEILSSIKRITRSSSHYGSATGPTLATYSGNEALDKFARTSLWAIYARAWAFLYAPLFHNTSVSTWSEERSTIVNNSLQFLVLFMHLALDEDFQPFQWSWPLKYQPLHALMIVIREVEQQPDDSDNASMRATVDDALALCGPTGSGITYYNGHQLVVRTLTEGGGETWDLIWKLRARAWIHAGADPDILPAREEVYERYRQRSEHPQGHYAGSNDGIGDMLEIIPRLIAPSSTLAMEQSRGGTCGSVSAEQSQYSIDALQPDLEANVSIDWNNMDVLIGDYFEAPRGLLVGVESSIPYLK